MKEIEILKTEFVKTARLLKFMILIEILGKNKKGMWLNSDVFMCQLDMNSSSEGGASVGEMPQ